MSGTLEGNHNGGSSGSSSSSSSERKRPVDGGFDLERMLREALSKKMKLLDDSNDHRNDQNNVQSHTFFNCVCENETVLRGLVDIMKNHEELKWYEEAQVLLLHNQPTGTGGDLVTDTKTIKEIMIDVKQRSFARNEWWEKFLDQKVLQIGPSKFTRKGIEDDFSIDVANWSRDPIASILEQADSTNETADQKKKVPVYSAFSGASGSGKTWTMVFLMLSLVMKHVKTQQQHNVDWGKFCLPAYISCSPEKDESINDYVQKTLNMLADSLANAKKNKVEKLLENWTDQAKDTILILTLDEVQNTWGHKDYLNLPSHLMDTFHFKNVVLLVGSTMLNFDVLSQPLNNLEVLNVRLKPIDGTEKIIQLFKYHATKHPSLQDGDWIDTLFKSMPILSKLMSNHRCADVAVDAIADLMGDIPLDELQKNAWGVGNSRSLLTVVASVYKKRHGLGKLSSESCLKIMLQSLALVSVQEIVGEEGVQKNPSVGSLAATAVNLIGYGLVERAILPDEIVSSDNERVQVDGKSFEFQMSPALTLICVSTIMPWIEGITDSADHFEALVACMMVVLRYAQTGKIYDVKCILQGVPYSGNESHLFWKPAFDLKENCFINGPQAPYADVILAADTDQGHTDTLSKMLSDLANEKFPLCPVLVQCKLVNEDNVLATCDFQKELGKMGLGVVEEGVEAAKKGSIEILSSSNNREWNTSSKGKEQFESGRWLTNEWVVANNPAGNELAVAFATNGRFEKNDQPDHHGLIFMESDRKCDFAWEQLYPLDQLVRTWTLIPSKFGVGRIQGPDPPFL